MSTAANSVMTAASLPPLATFSGTAKIEKKSHGRRVEYRARRRNVRAIPNDPDLWLYRDRTTGLLWRYTRLAVELGRLPSLLGREFFRGRVSRYNAQTFEDSVIFVHDVECCLQLLDPADKVLVAMLALEQRTQEETAQSLHCTRRTIVRHYDDALDRLTAIFLKREILEALPRDQTTASEGCQGAPAGTSAASNSG
jgi:DNA-directed RNA polymerase specialized sigma24 family protein